MHSPQLEEMSERFGAATGVPLLGLYTSFVFWTFKGKVTLDEMSY